MRRVGLCVGIIDAWWSRTVNVVGQCVDENYHHQFLVAAVHNSLNTNLNYALQNYFLKVCLFMCISALLLASMIPCTSYGSSYLTRTTGFFFLVFLFYLRRVLILFHVIGTVYHSFMNLTVRDVNDYN